MVFSYQIFDNSDEEQIVYFLVLFKLKNFF